MNTPINKRDFPYIVFIIVSFVFGLVVSWQRWGHPLIDRGREMMQPLRLMNGEMLYSDVRHIYGPLSPYLNAALYRVFGVSLNVLYGDGIVTAIVIIAVIYWLSRQLMNRAAATVATLSVLWLCAFKAAGNYFMPYSYNALHGCALGLVTLALIVRFVQRDSLDKAVDNGASAKPDESGLIDSSAVSRQSFFYLIAAGALAGLTTLAKTEMGFAALVTGGAAALLTGYPNWRRMFKQNLFFSLPAITLVVGTYSLFASVVGWHTLAYDSYLFVGNAPPELVYFNKLISGFDRPLYSLALILNATLRMLALAAAIGIFSRLLARRAEAKSLRQTLAFDNSTTGEAVWITYRQLWWVLIAAVLMLVAMPLIRGDLPYDQGPYLMMPVLLVVLLIPAFIRYRKEVAVKHRANTQTLVLIVIGLHALASLARMILRVRSGGAYGSFLLPSSIILFTYSWTNPYLALIGKDRVRQIAKRIVYTLLFLSVLTMTLVTAIRYRTKNTYTLNTAHGTMMKEPEIAQPFDEAIQFVNRETAPGDFIAVLPEGTSIAFLTNRRSPLREEIITPGYLDEAGEERAIRQLIETDTRVILIANRTTKEFNANAFGRDYCQRLMKWIETNYETVATFGTNPDPNLQFGEGKFFIRAYRKWDNR